MAVRIRRWLRSRSGVRIIAATLALLAFAAILGQLLGWWPAVLDRLQGTAGTEGVLPSQVQLAYFTASATNNQVLLAWKSEIETYNQGFNLYRAEAGIPAFTRVNADLIPSQATEVITSAVYEFTDTSVSAGVTYDYYIESIDMQALPTQHGSATVQVPQNGTGPSSDYSERVFLPFIRR
jgi:hypothetical protein